MYTRLIKLISLVLALSLVGNVQAQDATWTDASGDHNWFTPENWSEFPTDAHWAKVRNGLPGPTIASEGAVARRVHVGYSEGGALTVDGGTLVISPDDLRLGKNDGSGTLNMVSGSISIARDLDVGGGDPGIVNMTGGTINVGDDLELPNTAGSTGTLNMTGGTINIADNFDMLEAGTVEVHLDGGTIIVGDDLQLDDAGEFDITAGTLIIDSNAVSVVQGYIDNGLITAYGGIGTLNAVYANSVTTITAVHPLKPFPTDSSLVTPGDVELSWTLPDPCVPGQPVNVDVYFTDDLTALQLFTDPAAIRVVSNENVTSVVVQTQLKTRYYWAVDAYIGSDQDPVFGPIFSFVTADNFPPTVNAGDNVPTWVTDGSIDVALDATVTDDGYLQPYTVQWTVVSEPNDPNSPDAVITDLSAEDTSITLAAVGEYFLQLEAFDGEYTGSDTVTINVYNDSCEAAQSLPDYVPLVGDLNGDCRVDIDDMLLLLENWLKDISLTEQ